MTEKTNDLNRCPHGLPYSIKDCLCSPSHWTRPGDDAKPDEVISRYLRKMQECSEDLKQSPIDGEFDVVCGRGAINPRMDIYGTKILPRNAPIFAFVHGGFWQAGSRHASKCMVRSLVSSGFIVMVFGYDLAPAVTLEEIIHQVAESITYANSWALERNSKLYVGGHSAGGHLTFMGLYRAEGNLSAVRGAILFAGALNVEDLVDTYVNEALKLDAVSAKLHSPMTYVDQFAQKFPDIKLAIVVGEYDSPWFKETSSNFYLKIDQSVIDASFTVIKNEDHFSIIENLSDLNSEIVRFVCNFMK